MNITTLVMASLVFLIPTHLAVGDVVGSKFDHLESKGLTTDSIKVGPGYIEKYRVYLGKITVDPNKSSNFNPRYPGVVQTVSKSVGDQVKSGQVLATITNNIGVQTYSMRANHSGKVIHRKLAVGEFVDQERLAFSIANLDTMWVDITIRQSDLQFFAIDQEIIILNRSKNGEHTTGKIFYISPVVDQNTMSATATVEIQNPDNLWKPGQYVDSYIIVAKEQYDLTIDNHALVRSNENISVFTKGLDGKITKKHVKTGKKDLHNTQILEGLNQGEEVLIAFDAVAAGYKVEDEEGRDHTEGEEEHEK